MAPEADLLVIQPVASAVGHDLPVGAGRYRVLIVDAREGDHMPKAFAIAHVFLQFDGVEIAAIPIPAGDNIHMVAVEGRRQRGLGLREVRRGFFRAHDFEGDGDGGRAFTIVLDGVNGGEDAVEGTGKLREGAVRQWRRRKAGQRDDVGAGAGLGEIGHLGTARGPVAGARQPRFQEVNNPMRIGGQGGGRGGGQAQGGAGNDDLHREILEPADLVAHADREIVVMFHSELVWVSVSAASGHRGGNGENGAKGGKSEAFFSKIARHLWKVA